MQAKYVLGLACGMVVAVSCATAPGATSSASTASSTSVSSGDVATGTLARIYYWRAKPGQLDAYNRYVRDVAEPIDHEAQRQGAFLSVTTLVSRDTANPWTHMRVFILRDSAQLAGLSAALDAAGKRLEPDSVKRRVRGEYSVTLRDRVGDATVEVLR
jgi:hypothetical protein